MLLKKLANLTLLLIFIPLLSGLTAHTARAAEAARVIRYPRLSAMVDPQSEYMLEILRLAIKSSGQAYQLQPSDAPMQQARAIYEMASGQGKVDLLWTMSTDEREAQLLPIRIPIDKGLIGWRVALLTAGNKAMFKNVRSVKELAAFTAGQELDWPDVGILKSNGLPVSTSTSYEPLFTMLGAGRFDYFPRSVFEVQNEVDAHPGQNLHIDTHILLYYPSALYFFVTPRDPKMAEDLQNGLEEMIRNGSFEKIFQRFQQNFIRNLNLRQRTVIALRNPLLSPDKMPLNRPELWFKP
ncbi:transporter substrate-binding domain-containing protein [Undibacterium sp. TS12]|uniref:substrate-binding periplasmic protein n=1 Tax=Undibacterium sp. TS12 TaxID=2908202 RepID=UPI001F4C7214|nr:transporter substrate-binding domain-containing protein [Undibacterium sp. TS12]MCH8620397.1 transporter substrate-binding domain-containing protein [Undibacterium sp. TS12]